VAQILHDIQGIFVCDDLPNCLIVTSNDGSLSILSDDHIVLSTYTPEKGSDAQPVHTFAFSQSSCTITSESTSTTGLFVVQVHKTESSCDVCFLTYHGDGSIAEVGKGSFTYKEEVG
jgi:hypothetical protein